MDSATVLNLIGDGATLSVEFKGESRRPFTTTTWSTPSPALRMDRAVSSRGTAQRVLGDLDGTALKRVGDGRATRFLRHSHR